MYNKATKTSGFHDNFVKEETLHKAKKEKKHRRKIMLIFWNLSLSFVLRIRESGSYENVAVLFRWCERMEDKQREREREKKYFWSKKNVKYKMKMVTAALFRFTKKTNNGREKSWSKLALFIISTVLLISMPHSVWIHRASLFSNRHCAHILLIKYQVLQCMRGKTKPF